MNRSSTGGWWLKSVPRGGTGARHPETQRRLYVGSSGLEAKAWTREANLFPQELRLYPEGGGGHGRAPGKGMTWQICVLERSLWPGWDAGIRVKAFA